MDFERLFEKTLDLQKQLDQLRRMIFDAMQANYAHSAAAPVVIQQRPPKENMTIAEAAEYCGYSRSYLYQLAQRGEVPSHKPTGGRVFFKRKEMDAFIARGKRDAGYEVQNKAAAILNGEARI